MFGTTIRFKRTGHSGLSELRLTMTQILVLIVCFKSGIPQSSGEIQCNCMVCRVSEYVTNHYLLTK